MSAVEAELHCEVCDDLTDHELHYTGRLLDSVRCTRCGTHVELSSRAPIRVTVQMGAYVPELTAVTVVSRRPLAT